MSGHVGSHCRYCAGCRCPGCTGAHRAYLADWRAGRRAGRADAGPVRAHLGRLVAAGLRLAQVADEAGVPRRTAYGIWHGAARTAPHTAAALLAVRPPDVTAQLPAGVRLADARPPADRAQRWAVVGGLPLSAGSAARAAAALGVSERTVVRWRARQRQLRAAS